MGIIQKIEYPEFSTTFYFMDLVGKYLENILISNNTFKFSKIEFLQVNWYIFLLKHKNYIIILRIVLKSYEEKF